MRIPISGRDEGRELCRHMYSQLPYPQEPRKTFEVISFLFFFFSIKVKEESFAPLSFGLKCLLYCLLLLIQICPTLLLTYMYVLVTLA